MYASQFKNYPFVLPLQHNTSFACVDSVWRWRNINIIDYWEGATMDFYVRKCVVCMALVSLFLLLSIDR